MLWLFQQKKNYYDMEDEFFFCWMDKNLLYNRVSNENSGSKGRYTENLLRYRFEVFYLGEIALYKKGNKGKIEIK